MDAACVPQECLANRKYRNHFGRTDNHKELSFLEPRAGLEPVSLILTNSRALTTLMVTIWETKCCSWWQTASRIWFAMKTWSVDGGRASLYASCWKSSTCRICFTLQKKEIESFRVNGQIYGIIEDRSLIFSFDSGKSVFK